jgi:hypothetical protein
MSDETRAPQRSASTKRIVLFNVVFIAIALLLGGFLWSKRVGAHPTPHGHGRGGRPRIVAKASPPASVSASVSASASAAPAPSAEPPASAEKEEKPGDEEAMDKALDHAKVGPDGILFQPEGHYRSPFANPHAKQVTCKVGLNLNAVHNYDIKSGTFEADFYVSLWSATPMPPLDLEFTNGKIDYTDKLADKPTFKLWRYVGTFNSAPDLRRYPFDSQELEIEIEEDSSGTDVVKFEPVKEFTNLDSDFEIIGWDVAFVEARTMSHYYPDRFPNDDLYYHKYIFRLGIERFGTSAIFTVYVPAIVIVLISLMGMWVPPNEMEVRSNAGAPMLAAAVLFHFALIQSIPATAYLTRADKLMIGVYVSLFLCMISTWWFFLVDEENWEKVFRTARTVVPAVSMIVMLIACIL